MRLTTEKIDHLETMALVLPMVLLRRATLLALLADWRDMRARLARLEERLRQAESDTRYYHGLAGTAIRRELSE